MHSPKNISSKTLSNHVNLAMWGISLIYEILVSRQVVPPFEKITSAVEPVFSLTELVS